MFVPLSYGAVGSILGTPEVVCVSQGRGGVEGAGTGSRGRDAAEDSAKSRLCSSLENTHDISLLRLLALFIIYDHMN